MNHKLDVLIPTYNRPSALAVTLASLGFQTFEDFRIIISDQTPDRPASESSEVKAVMNVLRYHDHPVEYHHHIPARGMAEQRYFLLEQSRAPYVLFLDDDLILEPWVIENLYRTIKRERCGFVGNAVIGLSHLNDFRPDEQKIEFWDGPVQPETILPGGPGWERYKLHNAANLLHVQEKFRLTPDRPRTYKVAWVAVGVLYDVEKLKSVGGFNFWQDLPAIHSGEDVLAQLRVMARFGGCGLLPSGIYHQELETTLPDRSVDAPKVLEVLPVQRVESG